MTAPITWAEATSPILWSNIGIDWDTPAKANSVTYAVGDGFTLGVSHTKGASISFGLDASYANIGVTTMPLSVAFGTTVGSDIQHGVVIQVAGTLAADLAQTLSVDLTMNPSISFGVEGGYTSACNLFFSDSITFAGSFTQTAVDSFLWNPETDPTTTWTAVTDPSSTWSSVSDPSTTWTKVDYPD